MLHFFFSRSQIGTLHIGPYHHVAILYANLYISINFNVYLGGYLHLPTRVKFYNLECSLNGTLGGVQDLSMVASDIKFEDVARSAGPPTNGLFQFQKLELLSRSRIEMIGYERYMLSAQKIILGPGSVMKGRQLTLNSDDIMVAEGAFIDLNASGDMATGTGNV